ncbi:hypothetical protein DdX_16593 [Ditylenchus destructor]|uniref:Uncharacterized protein n=1 Tax=Ditylenchus destructor TaxID=166010 RepID=A0AAD4MQ43_9BILA|nr:hypothetical protein DdX_16593 [Ditylenchus destructor]
MHTSGLVAKTIGLPHGPSRVHSLAVCTAHSAVHPFVGRLKEYWRRRYIFIPIQHVKRASITFTMSTNPFLWLGVKFVAVSLVISAPVDENDECGVSGFPDGRAGERTF